MSKYNVIKAATNANIKRNGQNAITGPILNSVLNAIIDSLGKYYQFVGVATPVTNPSSPDQNVAYIASTEGTYAKMGGITMSSGELAVIKWDGEWVKETILILPEGSESNVFIATYGETPLADVKNAFDDGKIVVVKHLDKTFFPAYIDSSSNDFTFFAFDEVGDIYYCTINSNIGWSPITNFSFVQWSSVVKVWPNIPNHYTIPTTKLVKDSLDAKYQKPSGGIPSTDMDEAVQTSLGKADTAVQPGDLASVATSGDYNDLDNLPTIPAPQVQSDWDEADVDDPAYIKNKPSIPAAQVQSDWNEADPSDPAYIKNKPTIPGPDIFWAEYGVTTYAEVLAAYNAGKLVSVIVSGQYVEILSRVQATAISFATQIGTYLYRAAVSSADVWTNNVFENELASNKVSTISGNETDTTKYPNTKAVADALGKVGVISQTQTWTQAADGGYDYTMSNPVQGLIPQANIDLFESAGAVFNEQTGYFELNGLTDISYKEMQAIYNYTQTAPGYLLNRYNYAKIRTNLPDAWFGNANPNDKFKSDPNGLIYANGWVSYSDIEVAILPPPRTGTSVALKPNYCNNLIREAYRIKKIINILDITGYSIPADVFYNAYNLEDFQLYGLSVSTNATYGFVHCPRISPASVAYMINNVGTPNNIVITLHATAYARAIADTDVQTALAAHTNVTLASA